MISVLENYQLVSMTHVQKEAKRLESLFDSYDNKNNSAAIEYLRASLGPKMLTKLDTRDPKGTMTAAEIFMMAAAHGTSITPQEIDILKAKMKKISPMDYPGQNISDYCTAIRLLKVNLDNAGAYEQSITSQILSQLNAVTVETFRILVTIEKEEVDKTLRSAQGLAESQQAVLMEAANHTLERLLDKYEEKYMNMHKVGQWDPSKNKVDKKAPVNLRDMTDIELNAYIAKKAESQAQSQFDKLRNAQTKDEASKLKDGDDKTKAGAVDKSKAMCFRCGKSGHFKDDGVCRKEDVEEHNKDRKWPPLPGPNDPKEMMWKGKKVFFCAKCGKKGRWTLKHSTDEHKDNYHKKAEPAVNNFEYPGEGWTMGQF
jgi:hypothetical protein